MQCRVGIEQDASGESTDCQWRDGKLKVSAYIRVGQLISHISYLTCRNRGLNGML